MIFILTLFDICLRSTITWAYYVCFVSFEIIIIYYLSLYLKVFVNKLITMYTCAYINIINIYIGTWELCQYIPINMGHEMLHRSNKSIRLHWHGPSRTLFVPTIHVESTSTHAFSHLFATIIKQYRQSIIYNII